MMDDGIQLRQHDDDRQDIQEYSMPDSIPKNIVLVPKPSKENVVHAHINTHAHNTILHKHNKKLMNTNLIANILIHSIQTIS